jgi:hypothetical protein
LQTISMYPHSFTRNFMSMTKTITLLLGSISDTTISNSGNFIKHGGLHLRSRP